MITKAERWKVAGFSRQVELALFYDAKLDVPASFAISQRGDLFQMRDCSVRAGRAGEEIERYVLVVHGCECNVRVRPSGGIAHNDELKQKKARDHSHYDHMLAQRLPNEL